MVNNMDLFSYLLGKKDGGGGGTGTLQEKSVTVTTNTTQNITADSGYDGLSKVVLTTDVQPVNQTKSLTITENTTTTITPDENYDGLSSVEVTTNVPTGTVDTTDIRNVINMTDANITSQTPFSDYPQALYDGYIDIIKNGTTDLYDNLTKGTSTGTITDTVDLPIYEMKMTKESSQAGTPTPQNPIPIETVTGMVSPNLAYPEWAQEFVNRINNSSLARLETYDGKNCVFFTASTGYGSYATKYFFKTNWKANTQYRVKFNTYTTGRYSILGIHYTDGTDTQLGGGAENQLTPNTWNSFNHLTDAGKTVDYIHGWFSEGDWNLDLDTFMITEGTEDYSYQPYGQGTVNILISDGTNTTTKSFSLAGNEVVGKESNLDEIIIDKSGNVSLKKVFNKIDSYNGETITTDYISTTGGLDTGATIYYVRSTPQTINLNQTIDLTLYEGNNTITNSESMNQNIKYIKNTYE